MRLSLDDYAKLLSDRKKKPKSRVVGDAYTSNVSGWREISAGKRYYFRSLSEIRYAQYLQWLKVKKVILDWEFEPHVFEFPKTKYKSGVFFYLPDFLVTYANGTKQYHEVKGYLNQKSKQKHKRFKENYPNETLIIIGMDWFTRAKKQGLDKIINWEILRSTA